MGLNYIILLNKDLLLFGFNLNLLLKFKLFLGKSFPQFFFLLSFLNISLSQNFIQLIIIVT